MNTDKNYTTISLLLIDMLEVVILLITICLTYCIILLMTYKYVTQTKQNI